MKESYLVLVYLLMSVDGEITEDELKKFDEIVNVYGAGVDKNAIVKRAKWLITICGDCISIGAMKGLYNRYKTDEKYTSPLTTDYYIDEKIILWCMVNLSLSDGKCSKNELELINEFVLDKGIKSDLLDKLFEIGKTMYSLQVHLNWITSVNKPYVEIESFVKELKDNQKILEANLNYLLRERS